MANNRAELLDKINRISFVADETRLFLDTHPGDRDALSLHREMTEQRAMLMEEYNSLFGPMNAYDSIPCNEWVWGSCPWPWENGSM